MTSLCEPTKPTWMQGTLREPTPAAHGLATRAPAMRTLTSKAGEPPLIPMIGRYEGIGASLPTVAHPPYQTASLLYDLEDSACPAERRHAGHYQRR